MPKTIFSISIFGILGVLTRYLVGIGFSKIVQTNFPISTFLINIIGCFFIGFFYNLGFEKFHIPIEIKTGVIIGFLGGFTTFSSYSNETLLLFEKEKFISAGLYFILSPCVGLICTFIGANLSKYLN